MPTIKKTQTDRVIVARLFPGDDILESLEQIAADYDIQAGILNLIGAIEGAHLGYFNVKKKEYMDFEVDEDLEVVSCMGNISRNEENAPIVHAHMVVADESGRCYGGHLMKGCTVSVTIEIFINVLVGTLTRTEDESTGLHLLNLEH
ncbi:DNA-binding protein [Candidatus Thorarchaeota archaeon]|nr:MAG: DNA-binding protein [Candidatus Thorarchaeota archaeon]